MKSIRVATQADAEAVAAIYAPYVAQTAISFEETPPSPAQMAGRIADTLRTHPFLVHDAGDGVIGYAYAAPHAERAAYRWSCTVTVDVASAYGRQGVGSALYSELLAILKAQGLHAAFAGIALPNAPSVGLHEAMGFVHLGTYREVGFKHGRWHDVGWWRLGLADGPPEGEPIAFPDLSGTG